MASLLGIKKEAVDTPALLIDLDSLEKNIKTMADFYRARKGAALLPHQKGHRLPLIAKMQIEAGAKGVSMTSLGLAEYYVECGIDNILLTAEIWGRNKIRRLCALTKHAEIAATVDDFENAKMISEEALANDTKANVAIELYAGEHSCGVQFDQVRQFAEKISRLRGIEFRGLWHHGSEADIKPVEERRRAHFETLDRIATVKDDLEDHGISVEMLSAGYTCTWNITPEYSKLENIGVQAGSYVFSDWCSHHHLEGLEVFDCALTVLTRCISRPKPNEAMFDFGMNSCSDECGDNYHNVVGPKFKDIESVEGVFQREEISLAILKAADMSVKVGEAYELIPAHSDTTAKLYDKYYGIRNGEVEIILPNHGRGLF